jgi:hypothetical protein
MGWTCVQKYDARSTDFEINTEVIKMRIFRNATELDVARVAQVDIADVAIACAGVGGLDLSDESLNEALKNIWRRLSSQDAVSRFSGAEPFATVQELYERICEVSWRSATWEHEESKENVDLKKVFAEILSEIQNSDILDILKKYVEANADFRTYYNKASLKERGWTESMIRDFLGDADITDEPSCGFMSHRYFWLSTRVEEVEKTAEFEFRLKMKRRGRPKAVAVAG